MSEMPAVNLEGAVPSHLPVLPLKSTVVFPRIFIPLSVGRKKSLQLLEDLSGVERHIAVATQLDESAEEVDFHDIHHVGTMVRVQHLLKLPDGTVQLAVLGLRRIRLTGVQSEEPYLTCAVEMHPEHSELSELRERIEKAGLPAEAKREADREIARLERIPSASPESSVIRTYLELIVSLPWNASTGGEVNVKKAREILDADHYDLDKVKKRIVEHLAVRRLKQERGSTERGREPILCFVGPPGVGKTSLGQSIARAMGRKFARASLGGVHDEAEIRGHRRTYIGAMPGRILQAIRRAESNDPVFMLDEVDKLGADWRGDPSSALLEVLDPEQNRDFRDNYLDVPFDLSRVMFITTS